MKVIEQYAQIDDLPSLEESLRLVKAITGAAYKTESPGSEKEEFIIRRGLESALVSNCRYTVRLVTDRSTAISIEGRTRRRWNHDLSTVEVEYVKPKWYDKADHERRSNWEKVVESAESLYLSEIANGVPSTDAENILPNSVKTTVVITSKCKELLEALELRTGASETEQLRTLMCQAIKEFKDRVPQLIALAILRSI